MGKLSGKTGNLVGGIALLLAGIGLSLFLIVVVNQYQSATKSEINTECVQFIYEGHGRLSLGKHGTETIIYVQGSEKPFYFTALTNSYCTIDKSLLSDMPKGEKARAYVITTKKGDYAYEIVQMEFSTFGRFVLTFEQYNNGHRRNAIIGFVAVPIISLLAIITGIVCLIRYKKSLSIKLTSGGK
ncbi:MAG: hypothetical protein FWD58_03955 [Firmicutes bacterium]|nr:hypothetical protein [Bacillota bacterium]